MTFKGRVTSLIAPRRAGCVVLRLPATFFTFAVAIPIGVYSALRKYSLGDRALTVFNLIGLALPNVLLALHFCVSVQWRFGCFLLPTGGMTSPGKSGLNT